jgi:hypothetical protein
MPLTPAILALAAGFAVSYTEGWVPVYERRYGKFGRTAIHLDD